MVDSFPSSAKRRADVAHETTEKPLRTTAHMLASFKRKKSSHMRVRPAKLDVSFPRFFTFFRWAMAPTESSLAITCTHAREGSNE